MTIRELKMSRMIKGNPELVAHIRAESAAQIAELKAKNADLQAQIAELNAAKTAKTKKAK